MAIEVQQAQLNLVFDHEFQHQAIREQLTQQFHRALQKFDTGELDPALVADEGLFSIDRIEVDLGEISWENLEQQFSELLLKQLKQALLKALEGYQSPHVEGALFKASTAPLVVPSDAKKTIPTTNVGTGLGESKQVLSKLTQQLVALLSQLMAVSQLPLAAISLLKQWVLIERKVTTVPIPNRQARFKQLVALVKQDQPDHRCKQWQLALLHEIAQAPVFSLPSCWLSLARACQNQVQTSSDRISLANAWRSLLVTLQLAGVSTPGLASWLKPRRKRWYRRIQRLAEGQGDFQSRWLEQVNVSVSCYQLLVFQLQRFQRLQQTLEASGPDVELKYWQNIQQKIQADMPQPPSILAAFWVTLEAFASSEIVPSSPNTGSEPVYLQRQVLKRLDRVIDQLQRAIDQLTKQLLQRLSESQYNFIESLRQPFLQAQVKQWLSDMLLNLVTSNTETGNQVISKKLIKSAANPVFLNQKSTFDDIEPIVDHVQAVLDEPTHPMADQVVDSFGGKKESLPSGPDAETAQAEQALPLANLLQTLGQVSQQADELTEQLHQSGGLSQAKRANPSQSSVLLGQSRQLVDVANGIEPANSHPWYTERAGIVLLWPMMPALVSDLLTENNQQFLTPLSQRQAWFRLWLAAHPEYWVEWLDESDRKQREQEPISANVIGELLDQAAAELDSLFTLLVGLDPEDSWASEEGREGGLASINHAERAFDATDWNTELAAIHLWLKRFIQQWPALKHTSPMGLSHLFFDRDGVVTRQETGWQITVSPKAQDVLLQALPWPKSIIRLPWMSGLINIHWD